jgi:hypothetical protein
MENDSREDTGLVPAVNVTANVTTDHVTVSADDVPAQPSPDVTKGDESKSNRKGAVAGRKPMNQLCMKANRAIPQLWVIIACLAYIATSITAMQYGLYTTSAFLGARLDQAQVELKAQGDLLFREQLLYRQFDKVLGSQLSRGFMETYEDCLVRGISEADVHYFGLGFDYPDIRNQTVDWTTANCQRLHFTPQTSDKTPQQAVLTYWAKTTYRAHRLAGDVVSLVKQRVAVLWSRCLHTFQPRHSSPIDEPLRSVETETAASNHSAASKRSKMPSGFELHCEPSSPCRVAYTKPPGQATITAAISVEDIKKSVRKVTDISNLLVHIDILERVMEYLSTYTLGAEMLAVLVLLSGAQGSDLRAVFPKDLKYTFPRSPPNVNEYVLGSIILQLLPLFLLATGTAPTAHGDQFPLAEGVFMTMMGFLLMIHFFIPLSGLETSIGLSKAVMELYFIFQSNDAKVIEDGETTKTGEIEDGGATKAEKEMLDRLAKWRRQRFAQFQRRPISPTTTIREDLQAEIEALRAEKKLSVHIESDTESDGGHGTFVDLAGGMTLTTTEVESDWSIVDA